MVKKKLLKTRYGEPIHCKFCNSTNITRKGIRRLKNSIKQMYFCKDCEHRFSIDTTAGKKTNPLIILTAVTKYCQNYTLEEIQYMILKRYKTKIALSTIHNWLKEFNPRYLLIRNKLAEKYPQTIKSFSFRHSGKIYNYKYHIPKLNEFTKKYPHLISYITNLHKFIDNSKFIDSNRCSKQDLNIIRNLKHQPNNSLNKVTKKALELARTNKQRHKAIEDYFLSCDRDTIATEVPVWFWDKKLKSITGHIDILQIRNNKLYILDYKPNATKENIQKVTTQLTLYALALSFRAKIPLRKIRCAYFDEFDYYEFKPKL